MYEIGLLWEKGLISVAQEHLATSIVMRIMSYLYMDFILVENTKGKAIITASANEYHEIRADSNLDHMKILVGGYIFMSGINNSENIGADKISTTTYDTLQTARLWWKEKI